MTISLVNGVNPLQTTLLELGIVSGRVALLLRSAEIQPVFGRFVLNGLSIHPPSTSGVHVLPGGLKHRSHRTLQLLWLHRSRVVRQSAPPAQRRS